MYTVDESTRENNIFAVTKIANSFKNRKTGKVLGRL